MKYLIYLIVFIAVVIGAYLFKIEINMGIASYSLFTTLDKLLVLLAVIFIPIYIVRKILGSIVYKLKHEIYIRNIVSFINAMQSLEERNTLIDILKHSNNNKFIKQIKDISNLIAIQKYDKAIDVIDKVKVKGYNETLLLKYRCLAYKEKGDIASFLIYAKKGVLLMVKDDSLWFLGEMFEVVYKNKSLDSEIVYLYNSLKYTKNNEKARYKKYFCLINYFYAQYMFKQDIAKAKDIAKKAIKEYPDFAPMCELLIQIYNSQNSSNKVNDALKDLWKYNQSYEAIKLWQKYYIFVDENKTISDIKSSENAEEHSNLLIASIYASHDKFLEAHHILQNMKNESITKSFVELDIMQKENNFNMANKIIEEFFKNQGNLNFWNSYIS
ncbi:MAG: hypothetical protein LBH40_01320 [Alphaproteobacteria bacterium]|jgi:hypothetical protein|nr:hypothetical protein [Alphaproteobacteria bacterium]